ncbi:hypothetical protein [Roseovarius salinarum]|uniref:hypothetical protein n=1 Tax=Roseovarius salinarum TaxID=1981892 RepID=UPI000C349D94|nr:hypothetical protein [Roseovarius salinarum]
METDPRDPKGLIREAYRIEGIGEAECRSIFLDWALSLPDGDDTQAALAELLDRYRPGNPDHPMTRVMAEGRQKIIAPKRRGGWKSRRGN